MAIIYTYPSGAVKADDLILVSEQDSVGVPTKNITVGALAAYLSGLPGGPWLPLSAGSSWPLTGDLYMAPAGSGFSVGSRNIVFRGIDDVGNELDSARIFTLDSTINPSGQDLYIQNANDVGTLTTNIFVDAFGFVGIGKTNPGANLDIANDLIVGTGVTFSGYGSGTRTGTATYSLAVDTNGVVIEEPLGAIPWLYQYDLANTILIQGTDPGPYTGAANSTTILGVGAGAALTSTSTSVYIGSNCNTNRDNGESNVYIGANSGLQAIQGTKNTAVGRGSLYNETQGSESVAIGWFALSNQNGSGPGNIANTAVGAFAGNSITTGTENTILGAQSQTAAVSDDNSIIIGYNATGNGTNSITIGNTNNTTLILPGLQTTASDGDVLTYSAATGDIQLQAPGGGAIPWPYQYDLGQRTQIQGTNPGTTGDANTGVGVETLESLTTGYNNTAIGTAAGKLNQTSYANVFIGRDAGRNVVGGNHQVIIGSAAGHDITTAPENIIIGSGAGYSLSTGDGQCVLMGRGAGSSLTTSGDCIAIGHYALTNNTAGQNVAIGHATGESLSTGTNNVLIGRRTAKDSSLLSESVVIGDSACYTSPSSNYSGDNNIVIGFNAQPSSLTASNEITIGNLNTDRLRLPGSLPAFADDAAAGAGGILTHMLYQTDGAGAAPLNVAGIVMIKQ